MILYILRDKIVTIRKEVRYILYIGNTFAVESSSNSS